MANMNVNDSVFQLPITVSSDGVINKTLATADSYVDKNIQVSVTVPDAQYKITESGALTVVVGTTDKTYTSDSVTPYPVTITGDASIADTIVGIKTAGFASSSDTVTIEGESAPQQTKTIYIKEGSLAASGSASATGGGGLELGTKTTTAPTSGFYVKASAAGGASIATAGWVDPEKTQSASTSGDAYYPIAKVTFSNSGTGQYETISGPVLKSGDYLYINEGYIENTKISLADLVPDTATVVAGDNKYIYKTVSVYDKDGTLIAGSMDDATLGNISASGSATINSLTFTDNSTNFKVSGSKTISGTSSVSVVTEGYAPITLSKTGSVGGTASVNATIDKIGLGVSFDDADIEVTPVISKGTSTAKSGSITKTKPSTKYVAVNTSAISASATATPNVSTAGYGTTTTYSSTGSSVKGGAAASGTYYVPITAGGHSAVAGTPTINGASVSVTTNTEASSGFEGNLSAGFLDAAPTGKYITINTTTTPTKGSVSGTVTCTATEGYIEAGTKTATVSGDVNVSVTEATTKYLRVYDGTIL